MGEVRAVITFTPMDPARPGPQRPTVIRHASLALTWQVLEVLECWTHPHLYSATFTEPAVRRRYRLRLHGPLPGRPGERGAFPMVLRLYTDRSGWWMSPAERHPARD